MTLERTILAHYSDLYRFAWRMLGGAEEARDVVQEACLRLVREARTRLEDNQARRWLFVVVRNLCISRLRERPRTLALDDYPEPASPRPGPAEAMLAAERSRLVRRAVAALPPHLREVVILREYEDLDYARIAEITGTAPGTIKSRLARAREQLRRELAPLLKEDRP